MTAWRRMLSGLVLALVVAAAVGTAALAKLPKPPTWAAAVIAGVAFAVGLLSDPFKKLAADWIERPGKQRAALLAHTRMHDRRGRLRRVRDCVDPEALGVHPAATIEGGGSSAGRVPPYVRRDAQALVQEAFRAGGLVVIEGASTAGKSRLAYQAMHAFAAGRWLIVPAGPASLPEITGTGVPVRDAVVWLDDVERYLKAGGLDGAVLDALCPPGSGDVVVLATLRSEARHELTASGLETSVARAWEELMRRARIIPLDLALTDLECDRAEELRTDERIAAALDHTTDAGFAEYLAAGPATLQRWESALRGENLTAGAIISAAVDARRAGHQSPIPRVLLEALHVHYLDQRTRYRTDRPTFEDALVWVTTPVKGASGCLAPDADETYQPFDYLTDHAQRTRDVHDIPSAFWSDLLTHAPTSDMMSIGAAAYFADQRDTSEQAVRRAADAGDTEAMHSLGVLLKEAGRTDEAEQWYRRAVDTGHTGAMSSLGRLLSGAGRVEEAEQWFTRGADGGDTDAVVNLGYLLSGAGRVEEAQQWFTRGADAGDTDAMYNLGVLLRESGRIEEAEQWWTRAADTGHTDAMTNLGVLLSAAGRVEEAKQWWTRAADTGHTGAMHNLGVKLNEAGRTEEAEQWWSRAADAGNRHAMSSLGLLLRESGRIEEAEQWWTRAADAGDTRAMHNLGVLLNEAGRIEEAERWWTRGAHAGNTDTMTNLGALLSAAGRVEEAKQWWTRAADTGHTAAMHNLGVLLNEAGRTEEAEQWWSRAADM